jgi:hypothetical protein
MINTVACPSCRRPLRVPDTLLGQFVKCPRCEHTFDAPDDVEALPPPPPEPYHHRPLLAADDEDLDRPPPPYRAGSMPDKVQAIAVMTLVGGILGLVFCVAFAATCFGLLWPGTYYSLVMGVLATVKGAQLLGPRPAGGMPPRATAILQIINIVNLDVINLTLGILVLVFLHDRDVKEYLGV